MITMKLWRTGCHLRTCCFRGVSLLRCLLVGLAGSILISSPLSAETIQKQDPSATAGKKIHRLTLDEIVQIGISVSPKLMAQRYTVDQAEAQFKQSRAGRLPRLECYQVASLVPKARGDAVHSEQDRTDLFDDLNPFTRIELTVTQPLYTFGRLKAHMEAAEKGLAAKQAAVGRFEQDLIISLKELYYSQQLNNELYRLVSDTEEQFGKAVSKAEEMLEENTGTLTQQDLLKLRYGHIRAGGQLLELEKGKRLVQAAMLRLLMLPKGEDYSLAEKRLKAVKYELADLADYQQRALQGRPEKEELEAGIAAKTAELKAEQKGYFPDLFLAGKFRYAVAPNRSKQDNPFVVEDFNYLDGGMYVGWRLALDFGLPQRIAEKKAEVFALRQKQTDALSGILLEVEKAYQEVVEKKKALGFARRARKNGRALSTLSAASFQLGLGEAKEVFEAFQIYTESAARYYLAIKDYNLAVAELTRVAGRSR